MRKNVVFVRGISLLIAITITLGVTSCGTILYPERRGQAAGRIDIGVAALDGIGLLFFLLPGVIAFAVDFATGTIYLPHNSSQLDFHPSDLQYARTIQAESRSLKRLELEALIEQEIEQDINLTSPKVKIARVSSSQDLVWSGIAEILTPDQSAAFENKVNWQQP